MHKLSGFNSCRRPTNNGDKMEEIDLKEIRNQILGDGLKANAICKEAGMSESTFSNAINGHSDMKVCTLNRIIQAWNKLKED